MLTFKIFFKKNSVVLKKTESCTLRFSLLPINGRSKPSELSSCSRKCYNFLLFTLIKCCPSCCHSLTSQAVDHGMGSWNHFIVWSDRSNSTLPFIDSLKIICQWQVDHSYERNLYFILRGHFRVLFVPGLNICGLSI